jgi:hypothetical protein
MYFNILFGSIIFVGIFIFSSIIINIIVQNNLEKKELKDEYQK